MRTPLVARSFVPSIIGRLSLATSGLALVLLLEQSTGLFTVAGTITAVLGIANVAATPWRARVIDRFGQTLPLLVLGVLHAATLISFGLLATAPLPVLIGLGAAAGATSPPLGATMRVLWSSALPAGGLRNRGFSLDAVAEEATFAIGPLAAAMLAVIFNPFASLLLSAGCVTLGTALFIVSPLTRAQLGTRRILTRHDASAATTPLRSHGFPVIVLAMIAPGIVLGSVELAAPAIATDEGSTVLSGILLALFAGASAIGGLIYGRLHARMTLERQLLVLAVALLVVSAVTGLLGGVVMALVGFTLCGLFLAPVLIVGYLSADARTDERARTEASSWINTAVNFGAALGAVIFGALTDATGVGAALTCTALAAALIVSGCAPWLSRATP